MRLSQRSRIWRGISPIVLLIALANISGTTFGQASSVEGMSRTKSRQILWISRTAAMNKMQQLSLRAAREALVPGPPTSDSTTATDQTDRTVPSDRLMINEVESDVLGLIELWRDQQFDDVAVWETLCDIVLPTNRPDEVFEYQRWQSSDSVSLGLLDRSVGSQLIQQSVAAGKVADLRKRLEERSKSATAVPLAWLLLLQLAIEERNNTDATLRLQSFAPETFESLETVQRVAVSLSLMKAWRDSALRDSIVPVIESVVRGILNSPPAAETDRCAIVLSNILARHYFLQGQHEPGLRCVEFSDQFLTRQRETPTSTHLSTSMMNHHLRVARLLLQFGRHAEAIHRIDQIMTLEQSAANPAIQLSSKLVSLVPWMHQLPAKERFRILRYCLMGKDRSRIMAPEIISEFQHSPPESFKDAMSDSPGSNERSPSHDKSNLAGRSLSFLPSLFDAATEAAEADSLEADLLRLEAEGGVKATHVLATFYLQSGKMTEALHRVQDINESLSQNPPKNARGRDVAMDLLVATTATEFPTTRVLGFELLSKLRRYDLGVYLRMATQARLSTAIAEESSIPAATLFEKAEPNFWLSASNTAIAGADVGIGKRLWLTNEGLITHQSGPVKDSIFFPYPLTGSFEFSAMVLDDVGLSGDLGFSGLTMESGASNVVTTIAAVGGYNSSTRTLRLASPKSYARKSIRVTPDSTTFLVNGHPIYSEAQAASESGGTSSSPWLSLIASGSQVGVWKSMTFSGSPQIPREVSLSNDPRMRGWTCNLFDQSRSDIENRALTSDAGKKGHPLSRKSLDWSWDKGQITGRSVRGAQPLDGFLDETLQGHLRYDRPLTTGETLSWEFQYSPGTIEVHPALGRLAFLIRPDGVHLHWMSVGEDEWTSLPADNDLVVEKDRRGPSELPLRVGWNQASLSMKEDTVVLSLNDLLVYEHTLRPQDNRQFGFFHFRDQTTAQARNIVLKGDWPESLTAEHFRGMISPRDRSMTPQEKHVINRILGEQAFSTNVVDVCRQASTLPVEQRYRFLRGWVFPGDSPADWRLFGDMAPSDPIDSFGDELSSKVSSLAKSPESTTRKSTGGNVVAPALQLLTTARELGKLAELRAPVASATNTPADDRHDAADLFSLTVVNILLTIQEGKIAEALPLVKQISEQLASQSSYSEANAWPVLMVAQSSLPHPELRSDALAMLRQLARTSADESDQSSGNARENTAIARQLDSMISLGEYMSKAATADAAAANASVLKTDEGLSGWQPFRVVRADLRSDGLPQPLWVQNNDGSIQHVSGFEGDLLCYPIPLTGDFEFSCELTPVDGEHLLIGYGGYFLKPAATKEAFRRIRYGRESNLLVQPASAPDVTSTWNYRLVVSNGKMQVFVNDQELTSDAVTPGGPPWLCVRAASKPGASIQNWQMKGTPTIPKSVTLDVGRDLEGWCQPYFAGAELFAPRSRSASDWLVDEVTIIGLQRSAISGTLSENLLQYFRPMMEDGTITYSFLYEPGSVTVAPAMDRLAFLLDRDRGVLVHHCTDGIYERSGLDPANAVAEPDHQLVTSLPLRSNDWNIMQFQVQGNELTLILNDTAIFRRPLEPTNHRTFGLFHFKDQTTARVRGLSWQGNWPSQLRSLE